MSQLASASSRRSWLRSTIACLGAALSGVLLPASRAHAKKVGLKLAQLTGLAEVGGAQALKIKGNDVLLVRDSATTVKAVNPMCTHKKCLVRYNNDTKKLHCKCHKSQFELSGRVLGGPAKKDLATYPAVLTQEQVVLTLPDGI